MPVLIPSLPFLPRAQQESPFLHVLFKEAAESWIWRQQAQYKAKIRMAIFTDPKVAFSGTLMA